MQIRLNLFIDTGDNNSDIRRCGSYTSSNLKINLFEPPLIESNFVNITSPGEKNKNMCELNLVVRKILYYVNEDISESGQIFNFS